MFNCDFCHRTSKPLDGQTKIMTKVRKRTYPYGTYGFEPLEEKVACWTCAPTYSPLAPEVVGHVMDPQIEREPDDDDDFGDWAD